MSGRVVDGALGTAGDEILSAALMVALTLAIIALVSGLLLVVRRKESRSGTTGLWTSITAPRGVTGAIATVELLLEVEEPDRRPRRFRFEVLPLVIGRGKGNDLALDDENVSRHHARLELFEGELTVVDLESSNGTWVDKRKVDRAPLAKGQVLRVGDTAVRVIS